MALLGNPRGGRPDPVPFCPLIGARAPGPQCCGIRRQYPQPDRIDFTCSAGIAGDAGIVPAILTRVRVIYASVLTRRLITCFHIPTRVEWKRTPAIPAGCRQHVKTKSLTLRVLARGIPAQYPQYPQRPTSPQLTSWWTWGTRACRGRSDTAQPCGACHPLHGRDTTPARRTASPCEHGVYGPT